MSGAMILQSESIANSDAGWSYQLSFDQFDPAVGTLNSVDVGLTGDITGTAAIQNLGATPAGVLIDLPGSIDVAAPSGSVLVGVTAAASTLVNLGGFDGTTDFAGSSGTVVSGFSTFATAASTFVPGGTIPVQFEGTGSIDLTANSQVTSNISAEGNLLSLTTGQAGATVSVQYHASTGSGPDGDDSSSRGSFTTTINNGLISNDATTAVQTLTISDRTTGWQSSVAAAQFNPALGTLEAVNLTLIGDMGAALAVENLGTEAGVVNLTDTANVTLTLPGTFGIITASPFISASRDLAGFDGTIDFAGSSSGDISGLSGVQTSVGSIASTASNDLSAFIGAGTVALAVGANSPSTLTGPADLAAELLTDAGATVQISYSYLPATPLEIVPGGTVMSITGTEADQRVNALNLIEPFANVVVTDPNSPPVGQEDEVVTVTLSGATGGTLSGVSGLAYDASQHAYSFDSTAALVTQELRGLVYSPGSSSILPGQTLTTGFTIQITDSSGVSATDSATSVIATAGVAVDTVAAAAAIRSELDALAVAPAIAGTVAGQRLTDAGTVEPLSTVVITDANVGQTETVTVILSAAANGTLSNLGGGRYDATTGVYTDIGSAVAVTSALDGLVFVPTFGEVPAGQTVVTGFTISDTDTAGASATDTATSVVVAGVVSVVPPNEVVLPGPSSRYEIADDLGSLYVGGPPGIQVLPGVNEIRFTDGTGVFDPTGSAENIARLYQTVLDRAPDVGGLQGLVAQVDGGFVPLSAVASAFVGSPEFISDYGSLSNAAFVNQMYENGLGRPADAASVGWDGLLASGTSRGTVALEIAESGESITDSRPTAGDANSAEVYRLYQTVFDRAPDSAGAAGWIADLNAGQSVTQVAQDFVNSAEFVRDYGSLTSSDFVAALYGNALGRAPDAAGLVGWINQLAVGASRASVIVGFSDSVESRADTAGATHANWVFVPS